MALLKLFIISALIWPASQAKNDLRAEISASRFTTGKEQKVLLVCSLSPAQDLKAAAVLFLRRSGGKNVSCGVVARKGDNCISKSNASRYKLNCGSAKNDARKDAINYTLEIDGMTSDDYTDWWCQTVRQRLKHNTITLKENGVAMSKSDDDLGKPDSLILWIVVSVIFVVGTAAVVAVISIRNMAMKKKRRLLEVSREDVRNE